MGVLLSPLVFCVQTSSVLRMVVQQGDDVIGNKAHVAPEVLNAHATLSRGAKSVEVDLSGQAAFEAGVLLFELAVCAHPLGNYPGSIVSPDGKIAYSPEAACVVPAAVEAEMVRAGYPSGFFALIRRMVSCEAAVRPSLRSAAAEFVSLSVSSL